MKIKNAPVNEISGSMAQAVMDTFKSSFKTSIKTEQETNFIYMIMPGDHVILKQAVIHTNYRGQPVRVESPYFTHTSIPDPTEDET